MLAMLDESSGFMIINGTRYRQIDPDNEAVAETTFQLHTGDKTLYLAPLPSLNELWDCWAAVRNKLDIGYDQPTSEVLVRIDHLQNLARGQ